MRTPGVVGAPDPNIIKMKAPILVLLGLLAVAAVVYCNDEDDIEDFLDDLSNSEELSRKRRSESGEEGGKQDGHHGGQEAGGSHGGRPHGGEGGDATGGPGAKGRATAAEAKGRGKGKKGRKGGQA